MPPVQRKLLSGSNYVELEVVDRSASDRPTATPLSPLELSALAFETACKRRGGGGGRGPSCPLPILSYVMTAVAAPTVLLKLFSDRSLFMLDLFIVVVGELLAPSIRARARLHLVHTCP